MSGVQSPPTPFPAHIERLVQAGLGEVERDGSGSRRTERDSVDPTRNAQVDSNPRHQFDTVPDTVPSICPSLLQCV